MNTRIAKYALISFVLAVAPSAFAEEHHATPAETHAAPAESHGATATPEPVKADPAHPPVAAAAAPTAHGEKPSITPDQALATLTEGNFRFASGGVDRPRGDQNRRCDTFIDGEHPIAAILSCADSRVAPELLFDQGIGDLFVIRVAGNVADTNEIGTIEYGVGHLNIPLVVVIGHTKCDAVTAVIDGATAHGALGGLLEHIKPAAEITRKNYPSLKGAPLVVAAVRENVRQSIRDLLAKSPEIAHASQTGKVKIVGAIYDIHSGALMWIDTNSMAGADAAGADASGAHRDATPKNDPTTGTHDAPSASVTVAKHAVADAHGQEKVTDEKREDKHPATHGHEEALKPTDENHPFTDDKHEAHDKHEAKEGASSAGSSLPKGPRDNFLALGILLAGASGVSMGVFHLMSQLKHRTA